LKLAKTLADPLSLFPEDDSADALRKTCFALASSPGAVPFNYPIVGKFLEVMFRLGLETKSEFGKRRHKLRNLELVEISVCDALEKFFVRYGIEEHEIVCLEKQLDSISSLPVVLENPVFSKLMIDYA